MTCDRAEIHAVLLAAVMLASGLLAGCGPSHVRVPDTAPQMQPPPESAMRPCPTAETEGAGTGVIPDLAAGPGDASRGQRGSVLRAVQGAAAYLRTCATRVETLQEAIEAQLKAQREHAMSTE